MTEDQIKMLDECLSAEDGLTRYDIDFIERLDREYRDCPLGPSKAEQLQRINQKVLNAEYPEDDDVTNIPKCYGDPPF